MQTYTRTKVRLALRSKSLLLAVQWFGVAQESVAVGADDGPAYLVAPFPVPINERSQITGHTTDRQHGANVVADVANRHPTRWLLTYKLINMHKCRYM